MSDEYAFAGSVVDEDLQAIEEDYLRLYEESTGEEPRRLNTLIKTKLAVSFFKNLNEMLALCQLKNILNFKFELYNLMVSKGDTRITELTQAAQRKILTSILNENHVNTNDIIARQFKLSAELIDIIPQLGFTSFNNTRGQFIPDNVTKFISCIGRFVENNGSTDIKKVWMKGAFQEPPIPNSVMIQVMEIINTQDLKSFIELMMARIADIKLDEYPIPSMEREKKRFDIGIAIIDRIIQYDKAQLKYRPTPQSTRSLNQTVSSTNKPLGSSFGGARTRKRRLKRIDLKTT